MELVPRGLVSPEGARNTRCWPASGKLRVRHPLAMPDLAIRSRVSSLFVIDCQGRAPVGGKVSLLPARLPGRNPGPKVSSFSTASSLFAVLSLHASRATPANRCRLSSSESRFLLRVSPSAALPQRDQRFLPQVPLKSLSLLQLSSPPISSTRARPFRAVAPRRVNREHGRFSPRRAP